MAHGMFRQDVTTRACPSCTTGRVMTGRSAMYNSVSAIDGKQICPDCKLDESIKILKEKKANG